MMKKTISLIVAMLLLCSIPAAAVSYAPGSILISSHGDVAVVGEEHKLIIELYDLEGLNIKSGKLRIEYNKEALELVHQEKYLNEGYFLESVFSEPGKLELEITVAQEAIYFSNVIRFNVKKAGELNISALAIDFVDNNSSPVSEVKVLFSPYFAQKSYDPSDVYLDFKGEDGFFMIGAEAVALPRKMTADELKEKLSMKDIVIRSYDNKKKREGSNYVCDGDVVEVYCDGYYTDDCSIRIFGDVNSDGEIKIDDARNVLRAAVKIIDMNEFHTGFRAADVDFSNSITLRDARRILRVAVGIENYSNFADAYKSMFDDIVKYPLSYTDEKPSASDAIDFNIAENERLSYLPYAPNTFSVELARSYEEYSAIVKTRDYLAGPSYNVPPTHLGREELLEKYDSEYFNDKALLIVYLIHGSGSISTSYDAVMKSEKTLTLCATTYLPLAGTFDMQFRRAIIEIKQSDLEGVENIAVYQNKIHEKTEDFQYPEASAFKLEMDALPKTDYKLGETLEVTTRLTNTSSQSYGVIWGGYFIKVWLERVGDDPLPTITPMGFLYFTPNKTFENQEINGIGQYMETCTFKKAGTYKLTVSATFDVCAFSGTEEEWEKVMSDYLHAVTGKETYTYTLPTVTITVTE